MFNLINNPYYSSYAFEHYNNIADGVTPFYQSPGAPNETENFIYIGSDEVHVPNNPTEWENAIQQWGSYNGGQRTITIDNESLYNFFTNGYVAGIRNYIGSHSSSSVQRFFDMMPVNSISVRLPAGQMVSMCSMLLVRMLQNLNINYDEDNHNWNIDGLADNEMYNIIRNTISGNPTLRNEVLTILRLERSTEINGTAEMYNVWLDLLGGRNQHNVQRGNRLPGAASSRGDEA